MITGLLIGIFIGAIIGFVFYALIKAGDDNEDNIL